MTDTTQHDKEDYYEREDAYEPSEAKLPLPKHDPKEEELARLKAQVLAQQARIAQMRDGLLHYSDIRPDTPSRTVVLSEEGAIARKALATTDDLSALKAHDDALWNEALTRGIEWQATRGHTLDADDYENELRSLKR